MNTLVKALCNSRFIPCEFIRIGRSITWYAPSFIVRRNLALAARFAQRFNLKA